MTRNPHKLERLQRVRQVQEQQARVAWMAAERAAQLARAALERLRENLRHTRAELARPEALERPAWVAVNQELELHMTRAIERASRELERTQHQAELLREPWQARRRAAEGLSRLLERTQDENRLAAELAQNRELDEVGLRRAGGNAESESDSKR